MKNRSTPRLWMAIGFIALLFTITACERTAPAADTPPTATADPLQPTAVIVPALPSPTPAPSEEIPPTDPNTPPTDGNQESTAVDPTAEPTTPDQGQPQQDQVHTVGAGDTLSTIGLQYGVTAEEIIAANNLTDPNALTIGQILVIPAPGSVTVPPVVEATAVPPSSGVEQTHTVAAGENLFRIGLRYGCSVDQLATYNNIGAPYTLYVGDQIRIPASC